jgi:hypothetical protein
VIVFGIGPATRIYLAAESTDMRKGFEGLFGLVRDRLSCDPLSGYVLLFSNAQRNRLARRNRVYLHPFLNAFGATVAAPYSVRRRKKAPVSMPLRWLDVKPSLDPSVFNLKISTTTWISTLGNHSSKAVKLLKGRLRHYIESDVDKLCRIHESVFR